MKKLILLIVVIGIGLFLLSIRKIPEKVNYGVSFSVYHSNELKLDWKMVYDSILNDLGVKKFRFSAHWPLTEPKDGQFNWVELDYQIKEAEKHDAKVVLAVGRRLPGWPECHEPDWVKDLSIGDKQARVLEYIAAVVNRYKDSKAIQYWQVENEPFLTLFAKYHCGDLDREFLSKEVALVKSIDPNHKVLVTDSGELGHWYSAYNAGDLFGTSLYLYIWNHRLGPIRYPIPPAFFRIKQNIIQALFGKKDILLIELSAEPWLLQPIIDTPLETSLQQMNIDKFNKIIKFAQNAGFEDQYLWGAEWWYFMKKNNHPEFWERARGIFKD